MKVRYYSLKDLINKNTPIDILDKIIMEILKVTLPVKEDYPEYKDWFLNKQVKGINIDRDIIFAVYNNEIVGVSSIKGDSNEKKICTLYVKKCLRKNSIGTNLVNLSCEELETDKPLITISSNKLYDYRKIILERDWECNEVIDDLYKLNSDEYVFNGSLYIKKESACDQLIKTYKKNPNTRFIKIKVFNTRIDNMIISFRKCVKAML
jgi:hypothetical protein